MKSHQTTFAVPSCLTFVSALFVLYMMPGLLGKNVTIVVPQYARRGTDVKLRCHYDLEKEMLYALKWYVGPSSFKEFYRFVPSLQGPMAFNMPGIFVDVTTSNDHEVLLKNVSLTTSGVYKCSVTADAGSRSWHPFETIEDFSEMKVVVIGDDAPVLRLNKTQYYAGESISAECQSPGSWPPANITWYINDIKAKDEWVRKTVYNKDFNDPMARTTVSTISYDLPGKVMSTPVRLACRATVFTAYDQRSNMVPINPSPSRLAGTETLLRAGASGASISTSFFCIIPLILLFEP